MGETRLLTIAPYRCFPPVSGGGQRIFSLNKSLAAAGCKVDLFSGSYIRRSEGFALSDQQQEIAPGVSEHRYFNPLLMVANQTLRRWGRPEIATASLPRLAIPIPALSRSIAQHDIVMFEHPNWFERVEPMLTANHRIILDAHNVESSLFDHLQSGNAMDRWLADRMNRLERRAMEKADLVLFCSQEDAESAMRRFDLKLNFQVVPNGVDCAEVHPPTPTEKQRARSVLKLGDGPVVLFIGTDWGPNIEAAQACIDMAKRQPDVTLLIVGSVSRSLPDNNPPNVWVTGFVDDITPYRQASDVALNPMTSGSGSNVKLFEYLAAGLPVLSTPFGARGMDGDVDQAVVLANLEGFDAALRAMLTGGGLPAMALAARRLAEDHYDWSSIGKKLAVTISNLGNRAD